MRCGTPLKSDKLSLIDSLLISKMLAIVEAAVALRRLCLPEREKFPVFIIVFLLFMFIVMLFFSAIWSFEFILAVSDIFVALIFCFFIYLFKIGSPELNRKKSFFD